MSATQPALTETIRDRYAIVRELGQGSQGKLFLARDAQTGSEVAIKELDLELVDEWKAIELFDREAATLESLDHPGIPAYIDAFHESQADARERFFLVQEYIEGRSLSEQIDDGLLMDEARAREFLHEMLSILDYMQSLNPPVVHRDIKPSNIIVRPDGSHALVDFGAVQTILPETVGGSTVVGTTGFMPPEQLMGRATTASDIYALGATIVHAMSGIDPANLDMARMKLQFHDVIGGSKDWISLLDRMLEPTVERRLQDTSAVFDAMVDPAGYDPSGQQASHRQSARSSGGELVAWEPISTEVAELESNPPCVPLSTISASPDRLIVEVGPINPPARNWWMPILVMGLAVIVGLFSGGCLLPITIPAGIWLIFKGIGFLRPVSERLEMTPETLTIERIEYKRLGGTEVTSQTFDLAQLYLPHVHRVSVSKYNSGKRYAGGQDSAAGTGQFKPGKPGLIFTSSDGESVAFGDTILSKHRFIQIGLHDDYGELDWLDAIVSKYMTYVRTGAPDE
jgi:serine/threonine protein kinase